MSIGLGYRDGDSFEIITLCDKQELLDLFYPVGSCLWSVNGNLKPASTIGGSWAQIKRSAVLRFAEDFTPRRFGGSWQHQHIMPFGWDGHKGAAQNTTFYYWYNSNLLPQYGSCVVNGWQTRGSATMAVEQGSNLLRLGYTSNPFSDGDTGNMGAACVPWFTVICWERVA